MKKFRLLLSLSLALAALLAFSSCNSGGKKKQDSVFNPYVTGFSKKNISVSSSIEVLLSNEVTGMELNSPIDKKLFKFSPNIEGEAYLISPRSIEFRPKDRLKPGTEYIAHFEVGSIFSEVPAKLKTFTFNFATIQPRLAYSLEELKMYGGQDSLMYMLGGNLTTTDFVTDEQAEACLEVKDSKGNKQVVAWEHTADNRRHVFKIENIKSEAQAYKIKLLFNGKNIGYQWSEERSVQVPGYNDFGLLNTRVVVSDEQPEIVCSFSSAIDGKQSLDGLITLEGCSRLRYKVELNVVYVYPQCKVSGSKKLTVHEGVRSAKGGALDKSYEETIAFETLKPKVRFVSKGNIMPTSNGLHIPFQAVSLKAVTVKVIKLYESNVLQFLQVNQLGGNRELARAGRLVALKHMPIESTEEGVMQQWGSYAIDLSKLIEVEPGAIYRVEIDFNRSQALYPCAEESENSDENNTSKEETFEEAEKKYDNPNSYDYEYYYDEDYESSYYSDPCKQSYYSGGKRKIARNILASDLGVLAKQGENSEIHVVVTDLASAQPKSGATVEAYSYQQQLIGSATTNGDGVAQVAVKGVPYVLIAKKDGQRSYLRVDNGSALNLSNFDISGDVVQKGLKGFIYGERGVWRPGDTLFISFILEDRDKVLPENHPVNFELINPLGQVVQRQTQMGNKHHFYTFATHTADDAPTGNWKVVARVGGTSFSKNIKIETVKPNRLKVEFSLNNGDLITDKRIEGTLNSRWLHGATAKNLEAKINMFASSGKTIFKGYESYTFDSPLKQLEAEDKEIFSGNLNEDGVAYINSSYSPGSNAPGTIKLKFTSRVFEEGGDYSVNESSASMMPYKYYIGIKEPKGAGDDNMLETDKEQTYDLVVLDAKGNPADLGNIKVDIYKVSWSWWWSSQNGSTANYSQSGYRTLIKTQKVSTANGKGAFTFIAKHNEWGRYLITATDMSGNGAQAGILSYIDWPSWGGRPRQGDATGATMLSITTSKKKYQVGEQAHLSIPSSSGARALVSVENGSRVLRTFWVDCNDKQTDITFDLTTEMLPNVYAHVSLVQPHAQTKNDLPIRLYGVVPILVEDSRTILKPKIEMPKVLEPGKTFTVKVSEENRQDMTYTLAIVDEGLLDLTNFKTPSPWHTFFAREALGVRTWDLFDLVIGAFGGKIEQLFAIGGDDEAAAKQRAKVNRFKPVVKFLGPFTLSGRSNEHTITLPNYVGSVRAMVVAGNGSAYGSTEKAVPVRKPLMVLATLPRVLGPGEEVLLPANIFAMEKSVKEVNVELMASDIFEVEEAQKSLAFDTPGDEVITFKLKVKEQVGKGTVKITATGNGEKAEHEIEVAVRNANPKMYRTTSAMVEAGKTWSGTYTLPGMEGTNSAVLEVSSFPPLNLEERLSYLIGYPHGCIEQTTSKAFPQLYLNKVVDLSKEETSRTEDNVKAALERLKQFTTPEGGFAYWPGDRFPNLWGSSYAGHFIIEAEKLGYSLPYGMKRSWVKFQKKEANMWSKNSDKQSYYTHGQADFDQAYRLYTLALAKEEELGAMNRLKEQADLSVQARWCLAGAYAAIGQSEVAKKIISTASKDAPKYSNGFSQSFGSQDRDKAMIVETLTLLNMREDAFPLVQQISEALASNRWLGTQTTAYCLMSLSKFATGEDSDKTIKITYSDGGNQSVTSQRPIWKSSLKNIQQQGSVELKNNGSSAVFARVVAQGIPAAGQETAAEKGVRLSVKYITADGKHGLSPQILEQGTDFTAVVTAYNIGSQGDYKNLILNQIFPSGWEIINTRMMEGFSVNESGYDYRDIRDDRVYTYFPLRAGQSATYVVRLNAAYRGRFYMPASLCEAMYDAGIAANNTGMWVEVK
ncbi:MAG: hypothetical protein LBU92_02385 [Prevotellaceae bacterium]|jgi:uncharacterized protein YfaS (alpha-2-macroglobulin family)|nr:hypothetical protein [Prevotellaceae bacterium]